jgi:hypothetical protein
MRESEYTRFTNAARKTGVISDISPYEVESKLLNRLGRFRGENVSDDDSSTLGDNGMVWLRHAFETDLDMDHVSYDEKFCRLLRASIEDPLVVLLVALLPNLREIYIHGTPFAQLNLPWRAPRHQFQSLKTFFASSNGYAWPLAFFEAPISGRQLDVLEVHQASGAWQLDEDRVDLPIHLPLSLQVKSLNVSRVVLRASTFSQEQMRIFLEACVGLRSFHFSLTHKDAETFTTTELIEMLLSHKTTLKYLYLDMGAVIWDKFKQENAPLKSLAAFERLETIITSAKDRDDNAAIKDPLYKCLPRSIRHLTLDEVHFPEEPNFGYITNLISVHTEQFPNLSQITILVEDVEDLIDWGWKDFVDTLTSSIASDHGYSCSADISISTHEIWASIGSIELRITTGLYEKTGWSSDMNYRISEALNQTIWMEDRYGVAPRVYEDDEPDSEDGVSELGF